MEEGPKKTRQRLYLSEQTDGSEPNRIVIVNADVLHPRTAAADHLQGISGAPGAERRRARGQGQRGAERRRAGVRGKAALPRRCRPSAARSQPGPLPAHPALASHNPRPPQTTPRART